MHRCFLLPLALSAQLVIIFCCAVAAFPASAGLSRGMMPSYTSPSFASSQLPDSSSSSSSVEEELSGSDFDDLQSLRYRPKLLNLLQLGFMSSPRADRVSSEDSGPSSADRVESQEDSAERTRDAAMETVKRKFQMTPTARALHKKVGGLSLDRGDGPPRLSIVNPLDVLRQKMLLEMLRAKNETTQRIVDENARIMEHLGKRSVRGYVTRDRSLVRPNRQRLSQMLSSLVSTV